MPANTLPIEVISETLALLIERTTTGLNKVNIQLQTNQNVLDHLTNRLTDLQSVVATLSANVHRLEIQIDRVRQHEK